MKWLWESFMHLLISLETVTTEMLLQRPKRMKFTWFQDSSQPDRWQACSVVWTGLSWTSTMWPWLGTKWLSSFRSSEEVSCWPQIQKCCGSARSCLTFAPFTKPWVLCVRHTFTDNILWQMPEPVGWLCGKVGHCFLFVRNVASNKSCWTSRNSLCILTFWLAYVCWNIKWSFKIPVYKVVCNSSRRWECYPSCRKPFICTVINKDRQTGVILDSKNWVKRINATWREVIWNQCWSVTFSSKIIHMVRIW